MKRVLAKPIFQNSAPRAVRRALLRWYEEHGRDLPWRRTHDPYRIWVSEIMLQQTRVAAVLEHYRLFLLRFLDIAALAAASEDSVLAVWSGLGYYRRARMLHQCAREVVRELGGRFPQSSEALQSLPGIGRYTAAAIASIAFAEPVAVVDGNVERVLQRVTGAQLTSSETWNQAEKFLSHSRPGDFNQAMMELGATVCTPRQPGCGVCPVRRWCVTQGEEVESKNASPRQAKKEIWCALDWRDGQVRLVRRPVNGSLMAGMWELPQFLPKASEAIVAGPSYWRKFRHSITVTDYTVHVARQAAPGVKGKWVAIETIPDIPITGLARKILKASGII